MKKTKILYIFCLALFVTSCGDASKESEGESTTVTEETTSEPSAAFLWMEKIGDVVWIDDERPNFNISFGKPVMQGDIVTGEYVENFPGGTTICKYETSKEGVLNMQLVKHIENDKEVNVKLANFVFKLEILDDGNKLVINHSDGRTISYTRSDSTSSVKETKAETNSMSSETKLWMDKVATTDWKNIMNYQMVKFSKPTVQGDVVKGEVEMHEESFIQFFRYEKSGSEMKCKLLGFKIKGKEEYTEKESSGDAFDFSFTTELQDNGNVLILKHSNGVTYTYKPL